MSVVQLISGRAMLLQHQRLARDPSRLLGLDHRLRHARESGELIDHAADIADMAHDRVGALRESLRDPT